MARKAVMMFKDSYALQFINTEEIGERDKQDIDEKVIEQKIVQNIKNFIMTFGNDFTFVGNQYHLEIYEEEFFPDLIFFNRELNALVVVELKMGDFKPSYLGQLTTYLKILLVLFSASLLIKILWNLSYKIMTDRWVSPPIPPQKKCLIACEKHCQTLKN